MRKLWLLTGLLFGVAFCSPHNSHSASAQVIPTTAPTTAATSAPTTEPTTFATSVPTIAPTTQPAYISPGLPVYVIGTPPPIHVMTADYYPTSALVANCKTVAEFTTYDYPANVSQAPTLQNCGIKVVAYINPSMPQKNEDGYSLITTNGAQAKDCSGNNITTYSGNGLLWDPHSTNAVAYYQAVLDARVSEFGGISNISAFFSDNSGDTYGASANPCDWTGYTDWDSTTEADLAKINTHGAQLFLNSLSLPESYASPPADDTIQNAVSTSLAPTVSGAEQEGFIFDVYPNRPQWWMTMINTEIAEINANRIYWAYSNHKLANVIPDSTTGINWRLYLYASFLLGFDPTLSIYQTWFNTPSGSRVMPETGFVPTNPIETAQSNINELTNTSGLASRHFNSCYFRAVPVGACAVVVNPTANTVSVSEPNYSHSLTLSGGSIYDGGTVGFMGPQVTSLSPYSGAILLP